MKRKKKLMRKKRIRREDWQIYEFGVIMGLAVVTMILWWIAFGY